MKEQGLRKAATLARFSVAAKNSRPASSGLITLLEPFTRGEFGVNKPSPEDSNTVNGTRHQRSITSLSGGGHEDLYFRWLSFRYFFEGFSMAPGDDRGQSRVLPVTGATTLPSVSSPKLPARVSPKSMCRTHATYLHDSTIQLIVSVNE